MTYITRILRFGAQIFWRNIWLSLITLLIVTLNLFLTTAVYGLNVLGQQTLAAVREKISLSVYFKPTTSDDRASRIRDELLVRPDIAQVDLVTRKEHLEQFKKTQGGSSLVNEALDELGENPLGPGLVIAAKQLDQYGGIVQALSDKKYADLIEETGKDYETNQAAISKLSLYLKRIQTATIWLTLIFAAIAVLMVFNTIRMTIYSQREEIGIMKLVGASDAFVRGPFIVASVLYGLLAAVITTLIILPMVTISRPVFDQFFAGYNVDVAGYVVSHIWQLLGLEALAGTLLAVLSSFGAIGRYLRV